MECDPLMFTFETYPIKAKELKAGIKVGYLLLLYPTKVNHNNSQNTKYRWRVQCIAPNCNERLTVPSTYLIRRPLPKWHCGCQDRTSIKTIYKREYGIWTMMNYRCTNPNHVAWKHYGGRGIKVCTQWSNPDTGFQTFLNDMGPAPSITHSLDRIDPDGNYEPIHSETGKPQVKWATPIEQAQNTRKKYYARKAQEQKVTS